MQSEQKSNQALIGGSSLTLDQLTSVTRQSPEGLRIDFSSHLKQGLDGTRDNFKRLYEQYLDEQFSQTGKSHIVVSPHSAEVVSLVEAELFRKERSGRLAKLFDRYDKSLAANTVVPEALKDVVLIGGYGSAEATMEVGLALGLNPASYGVSMFANGELDYRIFQNVRRKHVYIIQASCVDPVKDVQALRFAVACARGSSAGEIHVIQGHFPYARQDRYETKCEEKGRNAISVAEVARDLEHAGADSITALDLHCVQSGAATTIPFKSIPTQQLFVDELIKLYGDRPIMVLAPDAGAAKRGDYMSRELQTVLKSQDIVDGIKQANPNADVVIGSIIKPDIASGMLHKIRVKDNQVDRMQFVGDVSQVQGRVVIIPDDLTDTCETLLKASELMKSLGAELCVPCISHSIMSNAAVERVRASGLIDKLLTTDTVALRRGCGDLIISLPSAPLIANIIRGIETGSGLAPLVH